MSAAEEAALVSVVPATCAPSVTDDEETTVVPVVSVTCAVPVVAVVGVVVVVDVVVFVDVAAVSVAVAGCTAPADLPRAAATAPPVAMRLPPMSA